MRSGAQQRQVSDGLDEVVRVVGAQRGLVGREGTADRLDFANNRGIGRGDELVDATREPEVPSAVKLAECQRHFKGGASLGVRTRPGGDLLLDPGAELGMPLLAELRAPCARRSALAGVARPEREAGEFADTQRAGAVIEGELHGRNKVKVRVKGDDAKSVLCALLTLTLTLTP